MRKSALALIVLAAFTHMAAAADLKAFKLTIGGKTVEINPGETVELDMPGAGKTKVMLERSAFASHSSPMFSFVHPSGLTVSQSDIDKDITQHLLASARGTLVIVQEYRSINPTSLYELMLTELTKESVQAGASVTKATTERTLADGRKLAGLKATVTAKSDVTDYEVFGFGTPDEGVLMITRIDQEIIPDEKPILDRFWETFELKL